MPKKKRKAAQKVAARSGVRGPGGRRVKKIAKPAEPADRNVSRPSKGQPVIPPIVAIGSSAGGLEALRELFSNMPPDSGLAFIMVMHLDPSHKSAMVELLSRVTVMPVIEAEDAMPIRANHMYIIPPGTVLTVREGRMRIAGAPPRGQQGPHPVDRFFKSVADDQGSRMAAVVLSGMGHDGTEGIHAVKMAGGLVIVQSPESAKAVGMPESAIRSDDADRVLPPREIPDALIEHFRKWVPASAGKGLPSAPKGPDPTEFEALQTALRTRTGHDFSRYKRGTIERRVRRRMDLRRSKSMAEYTTLVQQDGAEASALFKDVLVGVTEFFRDPQGWDALQGLVIDPLLNGKEVGAMVRVWVPGCSTGQEAYSLAMLLTERMGELQRRFEVKIFATDINEAALNIARSGVFAPESVEGLSSSRRQRFFIPAQDNFQVSKDVRNMVVFAKQSLIADPAFSRLDLVCCRNVLIYLDQDVQRKVLTVFYHALQQGGYLFLGSTESSAPFDDNLLRPLNKKWRIFQRVGPNTRIAPSIPVSELPPAPAPPPGKKAPKEAPATHDPSRARVTAIAQRLVLDSLSPASVLINQQGQILYTAGPTDAYLWHPAGVPTNNILEMVRPGIRSRLSSAIERAKASGKAVEATGVTVRRGRAKSAISIVVSRVKEPAQITPVFLIIFEERTMRGQRALRKKRDVDAVDSSLVRQLEYDLQLVREELQAHREETESANEELKAANEEVTSMNEELQSANEELETSKEELQSLNEELTTVNNQLQNKVEELEATNNDLENLLSSTDLATIFLDQDFNIRRFTPAIRKLVSLVPGDVGRPIMDFSHRFSDVMLLQDARTVLETLQPIQVEVQGQEGRSYMRRILPYRTEQDYIDGVVVTFTDITERTAAHGEQERLAAIVQSSDDAILSKDLNGRILTWNAAAERMFGYTAMEAVGKSITMVIPKDQQDGERALLKKIAEGQRVEHLETTRVRSDGKVVDVSMTVSPLRDRFGNVMGASTIARDIHERKAAELHQKTLVAELDHRVKNTLTVVLSLAKQTMAKARSMEDFESVFEGRILALSRAHQLLSTYRWRGGGFRELLSRTLEPQSLGNGTGMADGRITLEGPDVMLPPRVALGLSMVFHELVTNAVKYGALQDEDGRVSVRWRAEKDNGSVRLHSTWEERTSRELNNKDFTGGFGVQLIDFCVRRDLGGEVKIELRPYGLLAELSVGWPEDGLRSV